MKEFLLEVFAGLLIGGIGFMLVFYELIKEVILYCD